MGRFDAEAARSKAYLLECEEKLAAGRASIADAAPGVRQFVIQQLEGELARARDVFEILDGANT
jgi:hypothetical protein